MKSKHLLLLLLSFAVGSCESDPDIMNDAVPETLFVWGYADMNTGLHKVRIRRAILEEGNMEILAQDPKLLLPRDPLEVKLFLWMDSVLMDSISMYPTVLPKEEGSFSSEENSVHEALLPVPPGYRISLRIINLLTGDTINTGKKGIRAPSFTYPYSLSGYEFEYRFTNPDEPFHVTFPLSPSMVQKLVMEIKYVDFMTNGDTLFRKGIVEGQNMFPPPAADEYNREYPMDYLYIFINKLIPDDPEVRFRQFYRFNFKNWAGDSGLRNYLQNGKKFNDNRRLYFARLSGAYGLFYAFHYAETGNIKPSYSFPIALAKEESLKHLRFSQYLFSGKYVEPESYYKTTEDE